MKPVAIFLYEYSGKSAEPFAAAGWDCFCVDLQHEKNHSKGNIHYVKLTPAVLLSDETALGASYDAASNTLAELGIMPESLLEKVAERLAA